MIYGNQKVIMTYLLASVVVATICTFGMVYGDGTIDRNDQFIQFPTDSKVPVKLSIDGYINNIEYTDEEMEAVITFNTSKADSIDRCFCDIHNSAPINQSRITRNQINSYQYVYTLTYRFNSYLLHSLLSGTGIRCYVYNDRVLTQFQLVYNNTRAIHYAAPIESKFKILDILNEAPHMLWLSSITAVVVLGLVVLFPSFLWIHTRCTYK